MNAAHVKRGSSLGGAKSLTLFFKQIDKDDGDQVGGKGANLGEMTKAGFPVPYGFAITVESYNKFLVENGLDQEIYKILEIDTNNPEELHAASRKIQKLITTSKIPTDVIGQIVTSYNKISGLFKKALVAVRSSATAEDLVGTSFAGQQASFLNVQGENNLLEKVKECWASLFTERSIFYRVENKIPHKSVKISVIVEKMIQSEVSGVMFSIDPVTNDKDRIVIEAVWGLGEMIVQGSVIPDKYVVQKDTFAILSKEISDQGIQLIKVGGETKEVAVPKKLIGTRKITNDEIIKLAKIADKMQKHYYYPQDTEWAKEKGNLFIIQTRPVTTIEKTAKDTKIEVGENIKLTQTPILSGHPAPPGIGTGHVKILKNPKEIGKISQGDVLVAPMTSPDYVPAMKKASAIVTDQGGQTSHAAIVSRELGIPCVVGTETATKLLKEGDLVTVDGKSGQIYLGSLIKTEKTVEIPEKIIHTKTATKLYVNLAEPEKSYEDAKLNVDGVGLLRAEFMIANIGIHPKQAIKEKTQAKFIEKLTHNLKVFCKNFYPRPVTYRATDFKTNEYRSLPGGKTWEPLEANPMLGYRGAFRYVDSPDVFNLELQAIKNVRREYNNLSLMIPFVRSPEELAKVRRLVAAEGLFESVSFKFLMMVEIPVNVILIEEFIEVGIDGISIGSNDLTMLIQGTDRDNSEVASAFNERSPAVLWALRRVIKAASKHGISSSICGQAPSTYDDLCEKLVEYGIGAISVSPDSVNRVRGIIAATEQKIGGKK